MPTSIRLAGIAAATAALTLLAAPALAAPHMVATAGATVAVPTPAVKITPAHLAVHQYAKSGLVAHLTGLPAKTAVDYGYGWGGAGDHIGTVRTKADGNAIVHFVPPKEHAGAGDYSFAVDWVLAAPAADSVTTKTTKSPTGGTVTTITTVATTPGATASDPSTTTENVIVTYAVKDSDAKVAWGAAVRNGTSIALKATATRWSATAKKYVPWHKATVEFQERVAGVWKTKITATTNSKGVAAKTVSAKVHTWRAVVVSTKTTWGVSSKAHTK